MKKVAQNVTKKVKRIFKIEENKSVSKNITQVQRLMLLYEVIGCYIDLEVLNNFVSRPCVVSKLDKKPVKKGL